MNLDNYLKELYNQAIKNLNEYIEMRYIQLVSKAELKVKDKKGIDKDLNEQLIEDYLKKQGYTMNYILNKRVMIKDFTCVFFQKEYIEIWHDKTNNNDSIFITENYLTSLPITLKYMERI